ncbi:hypothetical protein FYC62_03900 [Pedobacter aquae]|uniref:Uncharacterized protein n=1 Tax=Pedobacter aquae TaxID=2605747 RepID=A0A5C0VFT8_9SPHI|nr:hypothetical protein [Pedobacter aquae]QEK50907.1 hypothetical protein FYC62_03900 [Pedobacter aquae]
MAKKNLENNGKKWTNEEVEKLKKLADGNKPTPLMAYELKRTENSIRAKARQEKVSLQPTNKSPYDTKVSDAKKGKK